MIPARSAGPLRHEAFVYATGEEYVDTLVPLLDRAVAAGDLVMAVVPEDRIDGLAGPLGDAASQVEFVAAEGWYSRPVTTIDGYRRRLDGCAADQQAMVVGEVDFGSRPPEWTDWTRYEAALNHVFADRPARIVCPYDRRRLPGSVVADAERTHPRVLRPPAEPSEHYQSPEQLLATLPDTIELPGRAPDADRELAPAGQGTSTLAELRSAFADAARSVGFDHDRTADLTLAVNEVLANAVTHLRRAGSLRLWAEPDRLVCVVRDDGPGLSTLQGFLHPGPRSQSGYGLWLARQLFDLLDIRTGPSGTEIALAATR